MLDGRVPFEEEFRNESLVDGRGPGVSVRVIFDMDIHFTALLLVIMFLLNIRMVVDASESKTSDPLRSKVLKSPANIDKEKAATRIATYCRHKNEYLWRNSCHLSTPKR